MGFTKEEWAGIHTIFVALFLISGILHLFYFNWRVFWSYIKLKTRKGLHYKRELVWSLLLFAVISISSVWKIPPIYSLVILGENIKAGYESPQNEPPIPHAEELSLREFAHQVLKIEPEAFFEELSKAGFAPDSLEQTIGDLANKYNISPRVIFGLFQAAKTDNSHTEQPSGYGQKSLTQICDELGIDMKTAEERLQAAGITKVESQLTLKQIADEHKMKPIDIVNCIKGK